MLQSDPSLAAVPDFSPAQWESLTRSVEEKKQKLEADIRDYIRRKQEELRSYEAQLLEQQRSMDRAGSRPEPDVQAEDRGAQSANAPIPPSNPTASSPSSTETAADSKKLGPGDTAKRTKHTRVHKREKELCGLVTPIFLPLLDAGESAPVKQKKERKKKREEKAEGAATSPPSEQGSPPRDADKGKEARRSRRRDSEEKMEQAKAAAVSSEAKHERRREEAEKEKEKKRSKRSTIKKSSLKHNGTPRARRKRVSLVIDDQIVLPADAVVDIGVVTSPSETAISSASNSTASLDDLVDPRLVERVDTPVHYDAVHHSLQLNVPLPSTSPTKHTGHTLPDSSPALKKERQAASGNANADFSPPKTAGRTFLDPAPSTSMSIPQYASPAPIYSNVLEQEEIPEEDYSEDNRKDQEDSFDTYVGGIDGSGVDDVDQAGSYGYPSSLGASYLESYMKARPLSVRIAAAERAELADKEKQALLADDKAAADAFDFDIRRGRVEEVDDDEMDVMGSMEGF